MGAIDATGNQVWTWTTGEQVPGGVPFWAFGEPSHKDHNNERYHCAVMAKEQRWVVFHFYKEYFIIYDFSIVG